MEDGELASPPIALPEVQGDVYLAWQQVANLFQRDGDVRQPKPCVRRHDSCIPD